MAISLVVVAQQLDALPIAETNAFNHTSVHPGKMHACGHDGHMAMLLRAAKYLVEQELSPEHRGGPAAS